MHFDFGWTTEDGLHLYAQGWQPQATPKVVVRLVHRLGEHSGRYVHLATHLIQAGYPVVGFDERGHGRSQGPRGHSPSYETLMQDISH
jgi:alpha-beta hydrolase superfamily lysophospholipase